MYREVDMDQQEIERGRIAEDYRNSIIANVEHDEESLRVSDDPHLREQYQERGRQLDENEACLKDQYAENGCEEQTGLSADGFRHQAISDYTNEQMSSQEQDAQVAQSYWGESQVAGADGDAQDVQADYWNSQSVNENSNAVVEDGNSEQAAMSNDGATATDVGADSTNSVSNENSI